MKILVTETIANHNGFVLEKILINDDYPAWFVGSDKSADYHQFGYFFVTHHCSEEYFNLSIKDELTTIDETLLVGNQGRSFSEMKSYVFY